MASRAVNAEAAAQGNGALMRSESYSLSGAEREQVGLVAPGFTAGCTSVYGVSPISSPVLQDHADSCNALGLRGGLGADACNDLHPGSVASGSFGSSSGAAFVHFGSNR